MSGRMGPKQHICPIFVASSVIRARIIWSDKLLNLVRKIALFDPVNERPTSQLRSKPLQSQRVMHHWKDRQKCRKNDPLLAAQIPSIGLPSVLVSLPKQKSKIKLFPSRYYVLLTLLTSICWHVASTSFKTAIFFPKKPSFLVNVRSIPTNFCFQKNHTMIRHNAPKLTQIMFVSFLPARLLLFATFRKTQILRIYLAPPYSLPLRLTITRIFSG